MYPANSSSSGCDCISAIKQQRPAAPQHGVMLTVQNEPAVPPAATPGPLQLLGLAASFAWSRRLRKRINQGVKP